MRELTCRCSPATCATTFADISAIAARPRLRADHHDRRRRAALRRLVSRLSPDLRPATFNSDMTTAGLPTPRSRYDAVAQGAFASALARWSISTATRRGRSGLGGVTRCSAERRDRPFGHRDLQPPVAQLAPDEEFGLQRQALPGEQRRVEHVGIVGPDAHRRLDRLLAELRMARSARRRGAAPPV